MFAIADVGGERWVGMIWNRFIGSSGSGGFVAICDVGENHLNRAAEAVPNANKIYRLEGAAGGK